MQGISFFRYQSIPQFRNIIRNMKQKINSLRNVNDKEKFRNGCQALANYLIMNKSPPYYYMSEKVLWEGTLQEWLNPHYKNLDKHGGCPLIMDEKVLELLELKYKELDFCEKRRRDLNEIKRLKSRNSKTCDDEYLQKCREYSVWIDEMKNYFETTSSTIKQCYSKEPIKRKRGEPQESLCHILKEETFKQPFDCLSIDKIPTCNKLHAQEQEYKSECQKTVPNICETEVPMEKIKQIPKDTDTQNTQESQAEDKTLLELQARTEDQPSTYESTTQDKNVEIHVTQKKQEVILETATHVNHENTKSSGQDTLSILDSQNLQTTQFYETKGTRAESPITTSDSVNSTDILKNSVLPSFSSNKSKLLTYDNLEHPIYDEEEIIKKIKINEITKNLNLSKQKKDRSKTIIEVHMEVLEQYRNEEWEIHKEEFLEICIDELAKNDYRTCPNLTDDDIITENIKSSNDINKNNILWNKWIERHEYLSEKLKKEDWFNNLKNEWKKELVYIKEMEELKKKFSNDNRKVPFLEIEKNLWKQWISEKGSIIEQYLEQNWLNGLTNELQNISEQCVSEETISYISLMNLIQLQHKVNYEELCRYIKKKLLTRLCILVVMTILKVCKKEVNIENRESYLDSSINEWKPKAYTHKNMEIRENIMKFNANHVKHKGYKEILSHIGGGSFRDDKENWRGKDSIFVNSIVNDGTIDKSDELEENDVL
ncbi:STP1 protein [Plasmodium malariae]|uniref:STP1 protein n=1 Tax=Plasmodium malariae TaxID=5858 RepID=A0A1A8X4B3_PLAMA|nr:STP1 protein [Plasmodium malariae]